MKRPRRRPKKKWGAYCNGVLCCSGTEHEMKNKVENEQRIKPPEPRPVPVHRLYWEAKRL
jgi:hypothetical protein